MKRIGAAAEQEQQLARIAVENGMVQPPIHVAEFIRHRMQRFDPAVGEQQPRTARMQIQQKNTVVVEVGMALFRRQHRVGIRITAPRNPGEIQRDRPAAIGRNRVNRQFILPGHPFAQLKNPRNDAAGFPVVIIVTSDY